MGSEPSAASGRRSEVSEWPRSKFPASAVRQRRNFGHRNRDIRIPRPSSPLQKSLSLRTSDRCHWCGNPHLPSLRPPCLKGAGTAKAVTGGFLSRTPCARKCLRRLPFFHQRKKGRKERRQNQWFWIPCAGMVQEVSGPFSPANETVQLRSVLSHCLRLYPPRRAPRLCCPS